MEFGASINTAESHDGLPGCGLIAEWKEQTKFDKPNNKQQITNSTTSQQRLTTRREEIADTGCENGRLIEIGDIGVCNSPEKLTTD